MPDGRVIGWSSIWVQNSDGGQIVESTPSRPRCYYLALKADAGSVPCSATRHHSQPHSPTPMEEAAGIFLCASNRQALYLAHQLTPQATALGSQPETAGFVYGFNDQLLGLCPFDDLSDLGLSGVKFGMSIQDFGL